MKNNKAFTVVELLASFALTMLISVFLFEVLIEVKDIFVDTSIKTNIQEKMNIISKNIRNNLPASGSVVSCSTTDINTCNLNDKVIKVESTEILIHNQKFQMPDSVKISSHTLSQSCIDQECYFNVQLTLTSENLKKDYKYNSIFYYNSNPKNIYVCATSSDGGKITLLNNNTNSTITADNNSSQCMLANAGDKIKVTATPNATFKIKSLVKNIKETTGNIQSGAVLTVGEEGINVEGNFEFEYGIYHIVSALSEGTSRTIVLDVANGDTYNGANVQIYDQNAGLGQHWKISLYNTDSGINYYAFQEQNAQSYLEVLGDGDQIVNGKNVDICQVSGTLPSDFQWQLVYIDNGYYQIKNKTGYCLAVGSSLTANGSNVLLYTCMNIADQKWKFVKVS